MSPGRQFSVYELLPAFPPGSLVALCGRPGVYAECFMEEVALNAFDRTEQRPLVLEDPLDMHGNSCPACLARWCSEEQVVRIRAARKKIDFRQSPTYLAEHTVINQILDNSANRSLLIDTVPLDLRSLSRKFNPWSYLAFLKDWATRQDARVLVHSRLLWRLEFRGEDHRPRWKHMPNPLRQSVDGAIMLYHPATYFPDAWAEGWHEITWITARGSEKNKQWVGQADRGRWPRWQLEDAKQ